MQSIENFAFDENLVRVVIREDDPWFVGKDVCHALGIAKHHQALERLDEDERGTCTVGTPGGEQSAIIVCEAAVYKLAFTSRTAQAKRFTRWVAHEVLPAIRKTGSYTAKGVANTDTPEPDPTPDPASERLLYRLGLVREARLLFGPERARGLWRQLGLPTVPPAPPTGRDEARVCLRHLLETPAYDGAPAIWRLIEAALEDDEEARVTLLSAGVRVLQESDGFLVANQHPRLEHIFAGTEWADGRWARVLRRLSGATPYRPLNFGNLKRRGTFVPADYLDDGSVPAMATH